MSGEGCRPERLSHLAVALVAGVGSGPVPPAWGRLYARPDQRLRIALTSQPPLARESSSRIAWAARAWEMR